MLSALIVYEFAVCAALTAAWFFDCSDVGGEAALLSAIGPVLVVITKFAPSLTFLG